MSSELYRDPSHDEIIQILAEMLKPMVGYIETEKKLKSGRVADLVIETIGGRIIIEVKPIITYSNLLMAYTKYYNECNALYLATPCRKYVAPKVERVLGWYAQGVDHVGLIYAAWDGVEITRPARYHLLP